MKKHISFCLLGILIVFTTCKKDEPECYITRKYIPQELTDYCDFPVGSYWIYKDSISSAEDTMFLVKKTRTCNSPAECTECPPRLAGHNGVPVLVNEEFKDYFVSGFFADTITIWGRSGTDVGGYPFYAYKWGDFPFDGKGLDNYKYPENVHGAYIEFYDSLQIQNHNYPSVKVYLRYKALEDSLGNNKIYENYIHYFSKNIGLIKYSVEGSHQFDSKKYVWELVRYHINK